MVKWHETSLQQDTSSQDIFELNKNSKNSKNSSIDILIYSRNDVENPSFHAFSGFPFYLLYEHLSPHEHK